METEKQRTRKLRTEPPFKFEFYKTCFKKEADKITKSDRTTDRKQYDIIGLSEQREEILKLFNSKDYNRFLVLSGQHGSGKTHLMKILSSLHRNTGNQFRNVRSYEISAEAEGQGRQALVKYEKGKLCIQDFGHEQESVRHFASAIDPIEELVYRRWERYGNATYFTSNIIEASDFLKCFSERTKERIQHKLDFKYLTGKNYRNEYKH